ncbi:MAG: hypothetical protein AAF732_05805 [Pseudomonadota bacterium]
MLRDMALDAVTGGALGLVFIAALYLLDIAQIGTLLETTSDPGAVIAMMIIGIVPFFAACAVAMGVMLKPWRTDDED